MGIIPRGSTPRLSRSSCSINSVAVVVIIVVAVELVLVVGDGNFDVADTRNGDTIDGVHY